MLFECQKDENKKMPEEGPFYHGTKADLKPGDSLRPHHISNYRRREESNYVYMTATIDAAVWGAELAVGDGRGRIYQVEPTGDFENDPNLTDKKFPGNPTRSYRTKAPLKIMGEVFDWKGHAPEELANMRENLNRLKQLGLDKIIE